MSDDVTPFSHPDPTQATEERLFLLGAVYKGSIISYRYVRAGEDLEAGSWVEPGPMEKTTPVERMSEALYGDARASRSTKAGARFSRLGFVPFDVKKHHYFWLIGEGL